MSQDDSGQKSCSCLSKLHPAKTCSRRGMLPMFVIFFTFFFFRYQNFKKINMTTYSCWNVTLSHVIEWLSGNRKTKKILAKNSKTTSKRESKSMLINGTFLKLPFFSRRLLHEHLEDKPRQETTKRVEHFYGKDKFLHPKAAMDYIKIFNYKVCRAFLSYWGHVLDQV